MGFDDFKMARRPAFVDLNELACNRVRSRHLRPFTLEGSCLDDICITRIGQKAFLKFRVLFHGLERAKK